MKPSEMKPSEKVLTFDSTIFYEKFYIEEVELYFSMDDLGKIQEFRFELISFIKGLESKWINRPDWNKHMNTKRTEIGKQHEKLVLLKEQLEKYENDLTNQRKIFSKLENALLPEVEKGNTTRSAKKWRVWPLHFSQKHNEKMKNARLPEKGEE